MRLREIVIKQAKLPRKAKKLFDGGGLFLYLTPSGKYWYYRYRFEGHDRVMALGKYPDVSLKEARRAHISAKLTLASRVDPSSNKRSIKRDSERFMSNSFESIAHEWYMMKSRELSSDRNMAQIWRSLEIYTFPKIGHYPIDKVPPMAIFELLSSIMVDKPETASRIKQRMKAIFDFAIQTGRATLNPAASAPKIIRSAAKKVRHHPALPREQIKTFFQKIETEVTEKNRLALKFLILTFVRSNELRFGKWEEIKNNEWHIPAERMKMKRPHIVPLSDWALEILEKLKQINSNSPYLIIGRNNNPISSNTLSLALKNMGYRNIATIHGFRAMASSILNESGLWNPDAIERQLAHAELNAVRAAYNRAEYLEERHRMMQWYSDFLRQLIDEKN